MPTAREAIRGVAVLVAIFSLSLVLAGCELVVEEPAQSNSSRSWDPLAPSATGLPQYDVSVSAIDFDPPLKRQALQGYTKPVKLLAAVENKGTMALTNLIVEASIASQNGDFSARNRVSLEKVAPGETRVVEFAGMLPDSNAPRSPSYRIRVIVEGKQLGSNVRGNVREVIVRVVDLLGAE